jgi:hypothetical protein
MYKKIVYIILINFLLASCSESLSSVKRGLTGAKSQSVDEFLIKKKDPLVLPPDYENLPAPGNNADVVEASSLFKETKEATSEIEQGSPGSLENSILRKIQNR